MKLFIYETILLKFSRQLNINELPVLLNKHNTQSIKKFYNGTVKLIYSDLPKREY